MIVEPKVVLLDYTKSGDSLIAAAAKVCYSSKDAATLMDDLTPEKVSTFVDRLMKMGHQSPFEHISFTFSIDGVSRVFLAQSTRHRIASYSVKSQRYVMEDNFGFVVPPAIKNDENAMTEYLSIMESIQDSYLRLVGILTQNKIASALNSGVYHVESGVESKRGMLDLAEIGEKAKKMAMEDARYVLPNATSTTLVVTMNARSLMNFFRLRCCNRAQWEIRSVANEMLRLCKEVAPATFRYAGAPCVSGKCQEGEMSCGKSSV